MKTPREILLARHKAIEPGLAEIRESVVAELNNKGSKAQSLSTRLLSLFVCSPRLVWRELILPSRWIWAGLATVWLVLLAANFSMRDHSENKMAKSPSPQVIMAFRQQQELLSELIGPDDRSVAEPQKKYSPRPASERRLELLMA